MDKKELELIIRNIVQVGIRVSYDIAKFNPNADDKECVARVETIAVLLRPAKEFVETMEYNPLIKDSFNEIMILYECMEEARSGFDALDKMVKERKK